MHVTASWGGESVSVEVDAECRSVEGLKRCLQEALPEVDVEAVRLEVCGRPVDDEAVLGLVSGSVVDVSASQAALAAAALREEGRDVDFNGFCSAAIAGDVRLCKLYLEAGVVVWPPGVTTPLHIAVSCKCQELCELLLKSGCDKDAKDDHGNTPLSVAVYKGDLQLAKLLLDAGCARDMKNDAGNTPLHRATWRYRIQLAELLLKSDCSRDAQDNSGNTALHLAALLNYPEQVTLFIDLGCAKDAKNNLGNTPLHCAVSKNNLQIAKLLLDSGCAKDEQNNDGNTPVGLAVSLDYPWLTKFLLDSGCVEDKKAKRHVRAFGRAGASFPPVCCVLC